MTDIDLDNETERRAAFEVFWKIQRKKKGGKPEARQIYLAITSADGYISKARSCVGDHLQATPEAILEGYTAYAWDERDTDIGFVLRPVNFLKQGRWMGLESLIEDKKEWDKRLAKIASEGDGWADARQRTEERHEQKRKEKFARFDKMIADGVVK